MAAWRKEVVDAARHLQEKREATRLRKLPSHTERYLLAQPTSRRNPCTDARRTETGEAPKYVDASHGFYFIFSERAARRGGGGRVRCQTFSFSYFVPCS